MDNKPNNDPKPALSTARQWAAQAAKAPQVYNRSKEEILQEWREWINIATHSVLIALSTLVIGITLDSESTTPLCRILGLLLPALALMLYYKDIISISSRSGTQGTAITLLYTSSAAMAAAMYIQDVSYVNRLQFILPCLLAALFFFILNRRMKRKTGKSLMWLILCLWLPFYSISSVVLLNFMGPPLISEVVPFKVISTIHNFHHTYWYSGSADIGEGNTLDAELKTTEDIYKKFDYNPPIKATLNKGLLGIDYVLLEFNEAESEEGSLP